MNSREQFEQAYSEDNDNVEICFIEALRQGDSYMTPKLSRAWYWWKRSRAAVVVELPPAVSGDFGLLPDDEVRTAIEAAGLKVAP